MIPPNGPERDRLIAEKRGEFAECTLTVTQIWDNCPYPDADGSCPFDCKFGEVYPYSSDPAICMELAQELRRAGYSTQIGPNHVKVEHWETGKIVACSFENDLAAAFCDAVTEAWLRVKGGGE